jgi:perosamine synthetase
MVTGVFSPHLGLRKEVVIERLRQRNIDSRPFFHPLSSLPAYRAHGGPERWRGRNPVAYDISPWAVNLPSGFNMTESHVKFVAESVREILACRSRHDGGEACG